jgi:dTDP-4-amino-4,6-dideoxygalactose transaminase
MARKKHIEDLAIFGAEPAFREPLHVGKPGVIGRESFMDRVNDIFERRWFTNDGPYLQEFEHAVTERLGVDHCVAVSNATLGLSLLAAALGLSGEVIMPSFTFPATPHALQWQKITPVFCDVDPKTHNLDPQKISQLITPQTSAILAVHLWGRACQIEALGEIARQHKLELLFDAAHAFACTHKSAYIGGFGAGEVFSFHATKVLHTFEGGAITTNDDKLADKLRSMRNFGFNGEDTTELLGINAKMTEISAAMGLTSLEHMDELIAKNYENYCAYRRYITGVGGLQLIEYDDQEKNSYQYIIIEFNDQLIGEHRDRIVSVLKAEGILVKKYFHPSCHRMEPYQSRSGIPQGSLTKTERLSDRIAVLPTGSEVSKKDVERVCEILRLCISNYDNLHKQMELRGIQPELSEKIL